MSEPAPEDPKKDKKRERSRMAMYAMYMGLGLSLSTEMAVAVGLGWFLGDKADKAWGIKPWGTMGGLILFVTVALIHVVMTLQRIQDKFGDDD